MQKRSVLSKILILVVLALIVPSMFAQDVACLAPYCVNHCPAGTHDCTNWWMTASWDNFYLALGMIYMGYTPIACCHG